MYDGDQITEERSWKHYTETFGYLSVGVVSVTPRECDREQLEATPDPLPSFHEHILIKFGSLSKTKVKKKAQRLRDAAMKRGWRFIP